MHGIVLTLKRKGTGEYEGEQLIGSGCTPNARLGDF